MPAHERVGRDQDQVASPVGAEPEAKDQEQLVARRRERRTRSVPGGHDRVAGAGSGEWFGPGSNGDDDFATGVAGANVGNCSRGFAQGISSVDDRGERAGFDEAAQRIQVMLFSLAMKKRSLWPTNGFSRCSWIIGRKPALPLLKIKVP